MGIETISYAWPCDPPGYPDSYGNSQDCFDRLRPSTNPPSGLHGEVSIFSHDDVIITPSTAAVELQVNTGMPVVFETATTCLMPPCPE